MLGLFVFLASLGFIGPNTTALALAQVERPLAGSAAALMGALQFLLGTAAGVGVSLWHAPSALPLVGMMLICGAGALALYQAVDRHSAEELASGGA
jgi:DHA1 family bicyclomycin/chloramphenicol resistance-like MFS transporter